MLPVCSVKDVAGLHNVFVPALNLHSKLRDEDVPTLASKLARSGKLNAPYRLKAGLRTTGEHL